jgi:hypothetical protein
MPIEPEWNTAIFDWFFGDCAKGHPVYLSVDEEVLADIARDRGWSLDDPVADFEAAIRTYVAPTSGRPFRLWAQAADRWRRKPLNERGTPPFLALLGATVLAATRESNQPRRPGGVSYYEPVRDLFKLGGAGMLEGYHPDVPNMWRWLNEWLQETCGEHGLPTAHTPRTYHPYIGYSLSQAVLLSHDRSRLTDFFDAIGAEPRSEVAPAELLARLRRWVASSGRATPRVRKALDEPDKTEILGDILASELRYWDGSIRDARGLRVVRVLPHIDAYHSRLDWVAFIPAGVGGRMVEFDGREVELPEGPRFVRFPAGGELSLANGASWVAGDLRFRKDIDPVMVFRPDDDVGGWVPLRRAEYGEAHYVLVHASVLSDVQDFFDRHLAGRVSEVSRIPLPCGWHLFRDVVLSTTTIAVSPALRPLLARADQMPELVGGLCVDPLRSMYLADAAPDVLVPGFEHELDIVLDGTFIKSVQGTGDLMPLADHSLSPGLHVVNVGSTVLRFNLVESRVAWPQEAQLGHNLHRSERGYLPDPELGLPLDHADVAVSGAAVLSDICDPELSSDPPMMVRVSGQGYLALGPRGFAAEVDVAQPAWAKRQGLLFNSFEVAAIESQVTFPVLWIGRRFTDHTDLIQVETPATSVETGASDPEGWRSAMKYLLGSPVTVHDDARSAWEEYCAGVTDDA